MTDYAYTVELSRAGLAMTEPFVPDLLLDTLNGLGAGIEDDDRGEASCPRVDFSICATPEAEVYLDGVDNPEELYVAVYEYDAQYPAKRYRRFFGNLVELPRRGRSAEEDVFIFSAVGLLAGYDEVDVVDPVSLGAYVDEHFEDLIPALTEAAGHVGGLSVDAGAPIKTADRWTSRLFYPGKHKFGGSYVTTDRITAMCNDGTYLYLGVGHWLCRYDPATRDRVKLARLNYTGSALTLDNYQFRIAHLTYSGGNILGWAESITTNLKKKPAHAKISFTYAAGNLIDLADANLAYCHNRGYYVRSQHVDAVNRGGELGTDFADWRYEQIGESQPPSDKTLGLMVNELFMTSNGNVMIGSRIFVIGVAAQIGDRVNIKSTVPLKHWQDMGRVTKSRKEGGFWKIATEFEWRGPTGFHEFLIFRKGDDRSELNLELPAPRDIKVSYEQPNGMASATPINVTVERRRLGRGRTAFFWPERLGEVTDYSTVFAPGPYIALGECNKPEWFKDVGINKYYVGEDVPSFFIWIDNAARFANEPVGTYRVENDPQYETAAVPVGSEGAPVQPGRNTLIFNGDPVTIDNEAGAKLETRGNIYLSEEGGTYYAAWNRWRWAKGNWFLQAVWGRLNGATIKLMGHDRDYTNYQSRPPREITSFKMFNGKYWLGVRRIEPRWLDTAMQIVWAAPPQTELKPDDYEGGLIVTIMVTYDKTEYLRAGDLIRVRDNLTGTPRDKEYLISEVETIKPTEIINTTHSYRMYDPEVRTRLVLFALDSFEYTPTKYEEVAKAELADTYITIMQGWDIRGEICFADGNSLSVGHTATAEYGEMFDGDAYDREQREWRGEYVVPDYDDPIPTGYLSEERVVPGSLTATLIDGKKEFTVIDKTSDLRGEMPIPPLEEVYVKHREGSEFLETALYFNPAYLRGENTLVYGDLTIMAAGVPFDVQYTYYTKRLFVEPFILDGALYFNETESGAIYRRDHDTGWTRVTAWPAPVLKVDVFGDDVYALAEPDYALMRYGKTWPGYINAEVGGADPISVFTALTKIAQAADCFMGEENGRIMFRPRGQGASLCRTETAAFEDYETLQYLEQKQYRGVLFTYDGGKAYIGQNDPPADLILTRDATYVFDYGLAYELARRYYEYFNSGAVVYDVEAIRNGLDVPTPAETVDVGAISGRLIAYGLNGPKIGMKIEKTVGGRLGVFE